jgi:hypothetical protein
MDRLNILGAGLTVFASVLTIWSYFFFMNISLTALGIGLIVLGVSILLTPTHPVPPHAVRALLEGSTLNIEALLEELNITTRGYYVKGSDGKVYVLIPIGRDIGPPIGEFEFKGLVTKINDRKYLALIPPSSEIIHVQELAEAEFDDALNYVLIDFSELAESAETSTGEHVVVKIKKPRGHVASWRFRNVLGSLEASIAASLLAKKYGVARVIDEVDRGDERIITLEIFQHG